MGLTEKQMGRRVSELKTDQQKSFESEEEKDTEKNIARTSVSCEMWRYSQKCN